MVRFIDGPNDQKIDTVAITMVQEAAGTQRSGASTTNKAPLGRAPLPAGTHRLPCLAATCRRQSDLRLAPRRASRALDCGRVDDQFVMKPRCRSGIDSAGA